jgi:hypothetical protein
VGNLAVLVSSCDKYHDLWNPFFTLFFRYWPDCPYPVYLVSNHLIYSDSRVNTIAVGDDRDWSSSLKNALLHITQPYLILLLEDYLIEERVDTEYIEALTVYMKKRKAGCLRIFPTPGPNVGCVDNHRVGEISKGSDYRLSLQAAIWDREVLLGLLRVGESPWELEILGSKRTDMLDMPFLSVERNRQGVYPITYFCTAVLRGKWMPDAVKLCKKNGINIDLRARSQRGVNDRFRHFIFRSKIVHIAVKWLKIRGFVK